MVLPISNCFISLLLIQKEIDIGSIEVLTCHEIIVLITPGVFIESLISRLLAANFVVARQNGGSDLNQNCLTFSIGR